MKILFVNYEYPPLGGGGGIVNAWLAEALAKRHDVTVLTSRAFELPSSDLIDGVRVARCATVLRRSRANASFASMASFVWNAPGFARSALPMSEFDIINTHFAVPSGPVGDRLARQFGLPNVLSVHGGDLYDPSKWTSPHRHVPLRRAIGGLIDRANAVVGQSRNTLDNLHNYYRAGYPASLIPLGIPRPPNAGRGRGELGLNDDEILLATVGRLVGRKAVHQLIGLVEHLADPRVRLLVLGDGPLRSDLLAQAHARGVQEQVQFCGFVDDQTKADLLEASDVFVSSSQHEGFGLVFLEAMAAGLPVVCYDHGGQTDFLDTETGAVVTLNDESALRQAVKKLIDNESLRQRQSQHNKVAVETYFIDQCAQQYEALFVETIDRHRSDVEARTHA